MPICTSTILQVLLMTRIPIQIQVIAIHVRIAMFMLLWGGGAAPLFLFRPNTYIGTCMSIEHIYMRPSRLKKEVYGVTL